ncbi:hypothetical protein CSPAE12_10474 [Colletotrichum incanum]|nr:hypothetical protein CSPAE12_10474 [Colletotrichum incanum]
MLNRRVLQVLWLAAALIIVFALFNSQQSSPSAPELTNTGVGSLVNNHGSRESMAEFMARSESIWAKTVKQRHEMIAADWEDISKMPFYAAPDGAGYWRTPYTVWDFAQASYNCPWDVERIGRMGDGGKWVCGMSRYENYPKDRECVIYSFGVRDESSFEQEMLSRTNCVVWAYDFSVVDFGTQLEPGNRDRAHFMQVGISGKTDLNKSPPFYSIADLMAMNGHDYIDILKMDIEGAEYEAMDGLSRDFPDEELPIGQLMVEVHLGESKSAKAFLDWWERLEKRGLRPAWTEPNLIAVTVSVCGKDPCMAEYSLINVRNSNNVLFHGR